MSVEIPNNLQSSVRRELSDGKFASESELVTAALETYLEMRRRHGVLKSRVDRSISQLQQGLVSPLDMDSIKSEVLRSSEASNQSL